jgi:hypothetical protein
LSVLSRADEEIVPIGFTKTHDIRTRAYIEEAYYTHPDKEENILFSVEEQYHSLQKIGFEDALSPVPRDKLHWKTGTENHWHQATGMTIQQKTCYTTV